MLRSICVECCAQGSAHSCVKANAVNKTEKLYSGDMDGAVAEDMKVPAQTCPRVCAAQSGFTRTVTSGAET
eukprot:2791134-Amphidinium_carterae.1